MTTTTLDALVARPLHREIAYMGFLSYAPFARQALLFCDDCEHFFCDGARSAKARRDSSPEDLAPFFRVRETLPHAAFRAGWRASLAPDDRRALWFCPECDGVHTRRD
jgi:hypothetical protein